MDIIKELQIEHNKMLREDVYNDVVTEVRKTNDYNMFKSIAGNRVINRNHLERLLKSMRQKYLVIPIIINKDGGIIDGQHRFINAMKLGAPVYYIMMEEYTLSDVQRLNTNSTNWSSNDYADGYADLGNMNYVLYKEYREKYGFGHPELREMLTGLASQRTGQAFKEGTFEITQEKEFLEMAQKFMEMKPFYAGALRRNFVKAMLRLFRNENFNFKTFLKKMSYQQDKMHDCTTVKDYLNLCEDIYNYNSSNPISLRYSR